MTPVWINGETWAVCGGRFFSDQSMLDDAMSQIVQMRGCPARIIHGDCQGADWMAAAWGKRMGIGVVAVNADWATYGPKAGPLRNQLMLDTYKPSTLIAFPGGKGTADMVRRSRKFGADVIEIQPAALSNPSTETETGSAPRKEL